MDRAAFISDRLGHIELWQRPPQAMVS
jgi:hypothetical protein